MQAGNPWRCRRSGFLMRTHRRTALGLLLAGGLTVLFAVATPPSSGAASDARRGAEASRRPPAPQRGRIANPTQAGQRILSALFFAGPPNPGSLPLYTRHPKQADRLDWSSTRDVDFALGQMKSTGLNTIKLSYWGHENETDQWSPAWLFSRQKWPGTGTGNYTDAEQAQLARDFMRRAAAKKLTVAPMLEVSPSFPFWAEFPGQLNNLVGRASWVLNNLGAEPNWLRVYDADGQPRYVIWLIETIHVGPIAPEQFAAGFDAAAEQIEAATGYRVGFIVDPTPLPGYGSHDGPEPAALEATASVLAVNPFNITSQGVGESKPQDQITEAERLAYAESILSRWSESSLPLIAPVLPGFDAHLVFPGSGVYGFNANWRAREKELAVQYGDGGVSIDCWNGWTEGYAIPTSVEDGGVHMKWAKQVVKAVSKQR
jgi:hypothetical protein